MEKIKLEKSGNFMWVTDLKTNTTTRFPSKDTYYSFEDKDRVLVLTWDKNNGETYHRYRVSQLVDLNEQPWSSFSALDTFLAENLGFNTGGGTPGTTPNLTQVVQEGYLQYVGREMTTGLDLEITYDWRYFKNLVRTWGSSGENIVLGNDLVLDINEEIHIENNYGSSSSVDEIPATPITFLTDAAVYYKSELITSITFNPGDVFILKFLGGTNELNQQIWMLTVFSNNGNNLPLAGGTMDADADINFANGSKISEGLYDAGTGGSKGIALTCTVGYEWKWEAGEAYLTNLGYGIVENKIYSLTIPSINDDSSKGFYIGSRWTTRDEESYICEDSTEGAAIWTQLGADNLTEVLTSGDIGSSSHNLDVEDYTFQVEDRLKINFFNNQVEESNSVFLDKTIIFPDNSTIIFQNQLNSIPIENIQLYNFLFTTDATVYYKGFTVTSVPIQPGDYCILKLVGFETDFNTQVWSLSILSKPTNPKVFTALLNQSGTSDSITLSSGDSVIKGITYKIDGGSDGDFSNIGAPSNDDSTSFIATKNGAPNSYGTCVLLYDPGAPIAKILDNTLGNVWFEYDSEGNYFCKSNCVFTENKTTIDIDPYGNNGDPACNIVYKDVEPCIFKIGTFKNQYSNGYLFNTRLEIEVYN